MLNQVIQVIELTETDDVDPELFSLLHSISLEAEPTPSLTYHTASISTAKKLQPQPRAVLPLNLESPPPSHRSNQQRVPTTQEKQSHHFTTVGGVSSSNPNNMSVASIDTTLLSGLQSSESQVRLAVMLKLTAIRERMGLERF